MPTWVRYRWIFLALALLSWGIAFFVLSGKGNDPELSKSVALIAGIVFVWTNGFFWLIEVAYPHIDVGNGEYRSRINQASALMKIYAAILSGFYFIGAIAISVVCIRRLYAG